MFNSLNSTDRAPLDVVEQLARDEILSSIEQLRREDRTNLALRAALKNSISIDELSATTGLTPEAIRRRVESTRPLLDEDLASLTGTR